jgi:hypothetical protein
MDETPTRPLDPEGLPSPDEQEPPVPNQVSGMSDDSDDSNEDLATAFKPGLDPDTLNFGLDKPASTVCQWCNALLDDPTVSTCPHCGAALQPVEPDVEVPGLTTMTPEARAAQARVERRLLEASQTRSLGKALLGGGAVDAGSPLADLVPSDEEAMQAGSFQPPDPTVQDVIRRMEIEALLARQNLAPRVPDETVEADQAADAAEAGDAAEASPVDADAEGAPGDHESA